ncbi:hypothetical protein [Natrialba asiatica]|uniref:Uncharacterized protein n=1 Tax=Natrialba asiatica (strain ATCC 700177 / DSM 12278 / JCM 9576 / FERM P-10747 / NBRC 102637 / 172P1) TaxID=29540 RepID=M0AJG6_NATA1|nr:hypothetical protein [Natrialba asiatica]ELY98679.1 hypothetical protein C481_17182 [Natrialba asiatica DSM 12278]
MTEQPSPHIEIANKLFFKLVVIGFGAAFFDGFVLLFAGLIGPFGPLAFVSLLLVNVPVLWLVLHAFFAAIDELLKANRHSPARSSAEHGE